MRSKISTQDRSAEETTGVLEAKNAAVLQLIRSWMADESGYDEETWPALKAAIEEDRPSSRKRFRD